MKKKEIPDIHVMGKDHYYSKKTAKNLAIKNINKFIKQKQKGTYITEKIKVKKYGKGKHDSDRRRKRIFYIKYRNNQQRNRVLNRLRDGYGIISYESKEITNNIYADNFFIADEYANYLRKEGKIGKNKVLIL